MSEQTFDRSTRIRRSDGQMSTDLGQDSPEVVVLDTNSNHYFGLESVAGHIWSLIEQPISVGEVVDVIVAEYEVDEESCLRDTLSFFQELQGKGLITIEQ